MNCGRHDEELDRTLRALHREAVAQVSPQVRRRLRAARDRPAARARASRFGWSATGALVAALMLAIALPLRPPTPSEAPVRPAGDGASGAAAPTIAVGSTAQDEPTVPAALAALEESPDFYLWLASNDAAPDGALP